MKKISVKNLVFSFANNEILKEISTDIFLGDMIALIGPNGSGKTTLMKCVNKIQNFDKGDILIDEKSIEHYSHSDIAKKIAYVPQHEIKISGIKVFDMVLYGRMPHLAWKPSEEDYKKVLEVMEMLKIAHLAMKDFGELSGGQQQMIYIARAIVQESPVILLDEPANNLDIKNQIEIMNLLKSLSLKGKTIIITLHDINMALQYCNKYILLKKGKIFAQGGREIMTVKNIEFLFDTEMKQINDGEIFYIMPKI